MSWSLTIGRFGATTVRVHLTFFLLLAWIGVSAWEKGGLPAARDSVLFIALIFTCVVLHEFGHIIMARRFGIETPDEPERRRLRPPSGRPWHLRLAFLVFSAIRS